MLSFETSAHSTFHGNVVYSEIMSPGFAPYVLISRMSARAPSSRANVMNVRRRSCPRLWRSFSSLRSALRCLALSLRSTRSPQWPRRLLRSSLWNTIKSSGAGVRPYLAFHPDSFHSGKHRMHGHFPTMTVFRCAESYLTQRLDK